MLRRRFVSTAVPLVLLALIAAPGCGGDGVATTTEGGGGQTTISANGGGGAGGTGGTGGTGGVGGTGGTGGTGGAPLLPFTGPIGSTGNDSADQVVIDTQHHIIVGGRIGGDVDFGGGVLSPPEGKDAFLLSLEADGSHRFSLQLSSKGGAAVVRGLAIGPGDDVIAAGNFSGSIEIGNQTLLADDGPSLFVARFETNGNVVWARAVGGMGDAYTSDVAVDAAGNIAVSGSTNGSLDFGDGEVLTGNGGDGFLAVFGPDGAHSWSRALGGAGAADGADGVGFDGKGDVTVSGRFSGMADFGGGLVMSSAEEDLFIVRYDAGGSFVNQAQFAWEGTGYLEGSKLAVDDDGTAFMAGQLGASAQFGPDVLMGTGSGNDVFVAALDAGLAPVWAKAFGLPGEENVSSVALGPEGHLALVGFATGNVDFGGGELFLDSLSYAAVLSPGGDHVWSTRVGSSPNVVDDGVIGQGIALDTDGSAVVVGTFQGAPVIGEKALSSAGGEDGFILRLIP